ncbi:MAG: GNAT family N-acetyltransferase [Marinibacterium sp.]
MTLHLIPTDADAAVPPDLARPAEGLGLDPVLERMRDADRIWLAARNGEAVGLACFFDSGPRPEIGYGVRPDLRGQGLAKAIVAALMDMARAEGHAGLSARTAEANPASGAVLSATGFVPAGDSRDPETGRILLWRWEAAPTPSGPSQ